MKWKLDRQWKTIRVLNSYNWGTKKKSNLQRGIESWTFCFRNLTLYHWATENYEQFLHLSYLSQSSRFHVGVYQKNTGQKNLHLKKSHDVGNIWEILWKESWLFWRIFTRNQYGFLDETLHQKLSLLLVSSFKCKTRGGKASNVSLYYDLLS